MKSITVYDPPMCCSSGVCGPDVDPVLPRFVALLAQLEKLGVKIERFNLAQEPIAFARNPTVRALLEKEGTEVLPLIFVDGELALKGHYPEAREASDLLQQARGLAA
jgi:hypothetical protein